LEAGLIVVGTRGLGRIRRTLAGSVSESVYRHAHCPVMVVRAKVNPPSRRGGGRPRVRRVFSQEAGRASSAWAQQAKILTGRQGVRRGRPAVNRVEELRARPLALGPYSPK
jgi:Universal stress protein family